ncbi:MAG: CRTAC1 family protein [Candidatus Acidiferrales bacterium]
MRFFNLRTEAAGWRYSVAVLFAALLLPAGQFAEEPRPSKKAPIQFEEVAAQAGVTLLNLSGGPRKDYLLEIAGNGAAFFDYDNDGDLDLLIVNGSTFPRLREGGDPMLALYENDGTGRFTDVTARAGLAGVRGWGMGVCVADFDNDGHSDFYLTAYGPNRLFRNNGDGTFAEVTARAGVGDARWSTGCSFGDYDRDGFVDLYVANYVQQDDKTTPTRGVSPFCQFLGMNVLCGPRGLPGEPDVVYRNNGDGTFTDVSEAAGIRDPGLYGFGVLFTDLDADGWPDIYVANDATPNFFFHNNRDGTFTESALEAGVALSEEGRAQSGMGLEAGDYNGDGRFDLFVTNFSHDHNTLYENLGDAAFRDASFPSGVGETSFTYLGWGAALADFDNDGWPDLYVANGHIYPEIDDFPLGSTFKQPNQLYHNLGNGRFRELSAEGLPALQIQKSSRGVAAGDFDNDGRLDLIVIELNDRPTLLRNRTTNDNHWLTLRLAGTKSNRDAIGARVLVTAAGRTQVAEVRSGGSYLSHHDLRLHFGLGSAARAERLEIRWPSGDVEIFENLAAGRFYVVIEGKGLKEDDRVATRPRP